VVNGIEGTFDAVAVGSGAPGLAKNLVAKVNGARLTVPEKAPQIGGISAWFNGMIWILGMLPLQAIGNAALGKGR